MFDLIIPMRLIMIMSDKLMNYEGRPHIVQLVSTLAQLAHGDNVQTWCFSCIAPLQRPAYALLCDGGDVTLHL